MKKGVWWGPVVILDGPPPKSGERRKRFSAITKREERWEKVQKLHLQTTGKKAGPNQKTWDIPEASEDS